MRTKVLIKLLQKLVDDNEQVKDIMGEHEIMIDTFRRRHQGVWEYKGFSGNLEIQLSDDGVYHILTAKETWE